MDKIDIGYKKSKYSEGLVIYKKIQLNGRADLAAQMILRHGLTAGQWDGEDSAGRARVGEKPINETVTRACDLADETMNEFEKRGWILKLPNQED